MDTKNIKFFHTLGNRPQTTSQSTLFLEAASESCLKHVQFAKQSLMFNVDKLTPMCCSSSFFQSAVITENGRVSQSIEVPLLETWCLQLFTSVVYHSLSLKR